MIHVGSQKFYDDVRHRLEACDLILAEGVNTRRARLLTLSYRIVKRIKRMDLVTQQDGLKLTGLRGRIVNADMEGRAFDEQWSSLPLLLRAQLFLALPVYVIYLLLTGTRETLAENIALEDLPSSDEVLFEDENFAPLDSLLIDERDRRLIGRIKQLYESDSLKAQTVGVLYGARHMRNVMNFMQLSLKYRISKAEWVTVFDL
jgi:hypothetical protein